MIPRVFFFLGGGGTYFHSLLCVGTSKSTLPMAKADMT